MRDTQLLMWDLSSIAHPESPAVTEWSNLFWDGPGALIGWALISSPSLQYYVFVKSLCLHWSPAHFVSCFVNHLKGASINKQTKKITLCGRGRTQ